MLKEAAKETTVNKLDSKMVVRGKGRAAEGINVMMLYIESEDGTSVDGDVAAYIRQMARSIWTELADVAGAAAPTWGQVDLQFKREYFRRIAELFPYLKLCHHDWKAHQISTECYSKWFSGSRWNKHEDNQSIAVGGGQNKRPRKDSMKPVQKRLRSDAAVSSIPCYLSHKLPNLHP
jgi:hypothetical protein